MMKQWGPRKRRGIAAALALALGVSLVPEAAAFAVGGDSEASNQEAEVGGAEATMPDGSSGGQTPESEERPVESIDAGPGARNLVPFSDGDEASLSLDVSQTTGTEPFQENDDPGNDSGPDNDIVRTNDTITYNLGIRYEGDDQTAPTVVFELPRGQELVQLPPFCLAGSGADPASLPAPESPLTATSWESLPRQTVTCVLADQDMGTALNYSFIAQVRPEVPNSTVMDEVTFEVTTEQVTEPATIASEPVTVSAAANFDLSKRVNSANPNQGWTWSTFGSCSDPYQDEVCRITWYPVSITVPAGGRGSTPLEGPISFIENLDPSSFYGTAKWSEMVESADSEADAKAQYAPAVRSCGFVGSGGAIRAALPHSFSSADYANETNAVRDSGTIDCTKPGRGESSTVTITGADTTAYTVPSTTGDGTALPANLGFVVSADLVVEVPLAAILEFGEGTSTGALTLDTHNEYTDFAATSLDGQPVSDANPDNNVRDLTIRLERGRGVNKGFTGIPGAAGNTPASEFLSGSGLNLPGPPGAGTYKDGNIVVMPGQAVYSVLSSSSNAPVGSDVNDTMVSCDVWDGDRLALAAHPDWNGSNASFYPGDGNPVFPALVRVQSTNLPASTIGDATGGVQSYKVEYSSGPAGPGADSDCSTGAWSEDPDDVATPTVDEHGRTVWEGINRVRVTWVSQFPAGTLHGSVNFAVAIGQVVLDGDSTTPIGNWASQAAAAGVLATDDVYDAPDSRSVPTYNPETHAGGLGDRLWQGEARVNIRKLVENPSTGQFTDAAVPQYTSGATVRYQLNPSLTGDVTVQSTPHQVTIEDCLPRFQVFESAEQGGSTLNPIAQQMGAPADTEIECPANRQYLKWDLGALAVGAPIEPIIVTAEILDVARNGVFTNDVVIASPADTSPVAARSDDVQMQLVVPTGLKISKTVDPGIIEVNPAGVTNPRTLTWSVYFANIDGPPNVANVDVIDVLPANGLTGNDFQGSLRFDSATPITDGITVLYAKTPSADLNSEPTDASNAVDGSTVWCDAPSGGAVVSGAGTGDALVDCPQENDEVTGLRFQRPGEFNPDDDFQVDIAMTPIGNRSGDVYRNITSGNADGVTQGVGPARRSLNVIASEIGDFVWDDANKNGIQDDGEPGVEGVRVVLSGTDADGNTVELETVTDEEGKYLFTELASGVYQVTFDISGLPSYTFTEQGIGGDPALDSNADPATGETDLFTLGTDTSDLTIDAGLVQHFGDLVINKMLEGAGVEAFGSTDELVFDVSCTIGDDPVFDETVTLAVNGQTAVTSDLLGPIPSGAECTVSEIGAGNADADSVPDPVTVTIPRDLNSTPTVTVSMTNYYSAGQVQLEKQLEGDAKRLDMVKDQEFTFLITCQVEEQIAEGDTVVADVLSGTWKLKGGETIILGTDDDNALLLPLGARCFGEETDDGGADEATISHDSFENAVVVESGTPQELQMLSISALNVFTCENGACDDGKSGTKNPGLAITGGSLGLVALIGLGLLLAAAATHLARRRNGRTG